MTLSNGNTMPQIGFGTGRFDKEYKNARKVLKKAIMDYGVRLIDTAKIYDTEEIIGEVL